MPITQVLLTASTAAPLPEPPSPDGYYYQSGNQTSWASVGVGDGKPFYNSVYYFPDTLTTGATWDFNGADQYMTTQGIFSVSQLYLNLWFYPTASGRIIMTIQGSQLEITGYHHSALEVNANLTVSGGFWNGASVQEMTTANTVTLDAWNHIYLRHNGTQALLQLNGATAVTDTHVWDSPNVNGGLPLVIGFGITSTTNMGNNGRYSGSIAEFRLDTANTASNYDATRSIYELPPLFFYDDFTVEWWQRAENPSATVQPFTIGLLPSTMELSIRYGGPSSGHSGQDRLGIANGFALASQPVKNHYTGSWEHMAIVRKDGDVTVYSNGNSYLTLDNDNSPVNSVFDNLTAELVIGTGGSISSTFFNYRGYIKDFYIVKGYAKYTENFTPSDQPVTPGLGGVFLMTAESSGTAFDDSVGDKVPTVVGTPTWSDWTPWTYPTQTFTAFAYGGNVIAFASALPLVPERLGLLVSDGLGWSDYVTGLPAAAHVSFDSPVPYYEPGTVTYTIEEVPLSRSTANGGGAGQLLFSDGDYWPALLGVQVGWYVSVDGGTSTIGRVTGVSEEAGPSIQILVNFNPLDNLGSTFTFYPYPYAGGSVYFDLGESLNYGASVDFTFDVDDIAQGSITLNVDANDPNSYSPVSPNLWTNLSGAGNITLVGNPYYIAGAQSSLDFNGTSQYGTGGLINVVPSAAYTKMVWFNIDSFANDNNLVSSDVGGHFMYFNQTQTLYAGHSNVLPYNSFGSVTTFNTDTWYCATVTFSEANGIRLYVNGSLDAEDDEYTTAHDGNGITFVACFSAGGNLLNGKLGRVICYGRELTAQEVLDNFNATKNRYGIE